MSAVSRRQKAQKDAVDDLVLLDSISEGKIIDALQNRYAQDQIYTNIASVLIAINPFKMIASAYTDAKIREYKGKKHYELSPHVFALADEAYSNMISYRENQCVIISGESGSGKTETSKFIMQYISGVSGKSAEVVKVKERMLSSNPILEGFGNAKTVNNNNSSRFGKYMEILFDYGGDPVGGRVTNYLLEKSRVVGPGQGERNFHVFYQVAAGATQAERQAYCLEGAEYYYYLSCSQCYSVPGINDVDDWKEMTESMRVVGITDAERGEVIRAVSVCLWLGNVAFHEPRSEQAEVQDRQVLDIVAGLLQVPAQALEHALCTRQITVGTGAKAEKHTKPLTAADADFCRDTLAKAIFTRMFDWLVHKINLSIKKDNFQGIQIGVLDIYGFEIFQYNSFEQLCINFVNEQLQQIFIELTLKAEQEEYAAEGIPWKDIPYVNNKPLCDLIANKPGLLSICDDCCRTAKTDQMFVMDLRGQFSSNNNIQCGQNDFSVKHYAGDVRYQSEGFLTKNKDTLFVDLILLMKSSPMQFVRDHGWAAIEVSEGQQRAPPTVGAIFRTQVQALMTALRACQPHYIRCIKPNHSKKPNDWDRENVGRQVKYLGLLENVRVRRAGYAHRSTFERFVKRYAMLSKTVWSGKARGSAKDFCQTICNDLGWHVNKEYAMGRTKIFIQEATTLFALEDALDRRMDDAIVVIQKAYRAYRNKRYFMQVRSDAYEMVNGRKERRRGSVDLRYKGDWISANSNKLIHGLLSMSGSREKLLFADRARHQLLKGKRSVLGSVFGKKQTEFEQMRLALLTDKALYSCCIVQDPVTLQNKIDLYFRVPILQISHVVASPYADSWVVIHFAQGSGGNPQSAGPTDCLWKLNHKTELFALLAQESKKQGRQMFDLRFQPQDTVTVNAQKKRVVQVNWTRDDMLDSCTDRMERAPDGGQVTIKVGSGLPPSQITAPPKPAAFDASVPGGGRPCLKALFDAPGNEAQGELAFRTGDIIFIIKDEEGGWFEGELNGKRGFVPGTYVERVKRQAAAGARPGGAAGSSKPAAAKPMFNFSESAASSGPPPSAAAAKKCDWEEMKTDDGQVYYWNEKKQESTWDKPAELIAAEKASSSVMSPVSSNISQGCATAGCGKPRFGGKPYCAQHAGGGAPAFGGNAAPAAGRPGFGGASAASSTPAARPAFGGAANSTPTPAARPAFGGAAAGNGAPPVAARPAARFGAGAASNGNSGAGAGAGARGGVPIATGSVAANRANLFGGGGIPMGGLRPGGAPAPAAVPAPVKKSDWVAVVDESSGSTYYWNEKTQESSWDKPAGFVG